MILKKSKLTYCFWALYLILFGVILWTASVGVSKEYFESQSTNTSIIIVACCVGFSVFLALMARYLDFQKNEKTFVDMSIFTETSLVIILTLFAFMLRFIYISLSGVLYEDTNNIFWHTVINDYEYNFRMGPAYFYYSKILLVFTELFGSDPIVSIYLEAFCQLVLNLIIYYSVRMMMGRTPAFMSAILYGFLPWNVIKLGVNSEDTFVAFCIMLSFMLIVYCAHELSMNNLKGSNGFMALLLSGLFSGFTSFIDRTGFVLIVFAFLCFLLNKSRVAYTFALNDSTEKKRINLSSNIGVQMLILGIGFVGAFVASIYGCANDTIYSVKEVLYSYLNGFGNTSVVYFTAIPAYGDISGLILLSLSSIWLIRIFAIERDHGSYIVIIPIALLTSSFLGFTDENYITSSTAMWCILGGMGFASIGSNNLDKAIAFKEEKEKNKLEEKIRAKKEREEALEKEKEEQILRNKINKDAKVRDKEKVLSLLNEKTTKEAQKDMFGRGKDKSKEVVLSNAEEKTVSLAELEAELDFLHTGIENNDSNTDINTFDSKEAFVSDTASEENAIKDYVKVFEESIPAEEVVTVVEEVKAEVPVVAEPVKPMVSSNPGVVLMNPYGRRMDYKTAKVNKSETSTDNQLNTEVVSAASVEPVNQVSEPNSIQTSVVENIINEQADKLDLNNNMASPATLPVSGQPVANALPITGQPVNVSLPVSSEASASGIPSMLPTSNNASSGSLVLPVSESTNTVSGITNNSNEVKLSFVPANDVKVAAVEPVSETRNEANNESSDDISNVILSETLNATSEDNSISDSVLNIAESTTSEAENKSVISVEEAKEKVKEETVKEIVKEKTIEEAPAKKVEPIYNPLPTPKKHVAKHLEYDIPVPSSQMHFDLLDMSGKDYFDIN